MAVFNKEDEEYHISYQYYSYISSFSRRDEPEGVSTMEWGVAEVKKAGRVPDVIYDKGDVGKEAMVRLLGKDAIEVGGGLLGYRCDDKKKI